MAQHQESIVVRIAADPPALLWSGLGNIELPADAVIPVASIALGAGELVSVPDFQQIMDGRAERLDMVFSGVSEETVRLALEDAPSVRNARVDVGRIMLDSDWQRSGPVAWEATFEARSLTVSRPQADSGQITRSITLTIAHGDTTRSRAPIAYFTDADQRRKYPTDSVFSHVAGISAGTSRRFGPR